MWVDSLDELGIDTTDPVHNLLVDTGALSTNLRSKCKKLSVHVILQELSTATPEEMQLLNISEYNSFIREVFLLGDKIPLIQARVIAPMRSYIQFKDTLDNLGNKLLGETLLYAQTYSRSQFQYTKINNELARRSVFDLQGYTILVQEIFLFSSFCNNI